MAAHNSWAKLPSVIIVEILSYLSLVDRLNASSACRRWRSCLFHPSLWRSISFRVKQGGRRRAKHLADVCGRFVREAVVEFNSQTVGNVRESLRILNILSNNYNLEKLALKPQSCQIAWPEKEPSYTIDLFLDTVEAAVKNPRHLKELSLGCIGELCDHADELMPLLASHQASSLHTLHISSVKEDPDSYALLELSHTHFEAFQHLRILGIDYDYVTNQLLQVLARPDRVPLEKMIIHVHGIEPDHEKITNCSWRHLVRRSPQLEVTLNLVHSIDGVTNLLDILQPAMPLAHLRLLFCQQLNVAAINFIVQHNCNVLKSVHIIDGIQEDRPNVYDTQTDEDPFVMMAWKCPNLKEFTLIGYDVCKDDVIAIARLRGSQLKTLAVPACCVSTVEEEEDSVWVAFGSYGPEFVEEVSRCLGFDWEPIDDLLLHPAVKDPLADAETAYLHLLLQDQA